MSKYKGYKDIRVIEMEEALENLDELAWNLMDAPGFSEVKIRKTDLRLLMGSGMQKLEERLEERLERLGISRMKSITYECSKCGHTEHLDYKVPLSITCTNCSKSSFNLSYRTGFRCLETHEIKITINDKKL